jgi:hypothetical protein
VKEDETLDFNSFIIDITMILEREKDVATPIS